MSNVDVDEIGHTNTIESNEAFKRRMGLWETPLMSLPRRRRRLKDWILRGTIFVGILIMIAITLILK